MGHISANYTGAILSHFTSTNFAFYDFVGCKAFILELGTQT